MECACKEGKKGDGAKVLGGVAWVSAFLAVMRGGVATRRAKMSEILADARPRQRGEGWERAGEKCRA